VRIDDTPAGLQLAVAAEVRAELARKQMSQHALAAALGVAQQTVSRRLTGEVPFDVAELGRVAEILGVPVGQFFPASAVA
jgi:transcriptional regulator with XRE-family HTH domain